MSVPLLCEIVIQSMIIQECRWSVLWDQIWLQLQKKKKNFIYRNHHDHRASISQNKVERPEISRDISKNQFVSRQQEFSKQNQKKKNFFLLVKLIFYRDKIFFYSSWIFVTLLVWSCFHLFFPFGNVLFDAFGKLAIDANISLLTVRKPRCDIYRKTFAAKQKKKREEVTNPEVNRYVLLCSVSIHESKMKLKKHWRIMDIKSKGETIP
ncbi:hypothetical protein RFI_08000 [Reticulomyxa filosa]|uniref:Transmembrane protein n=1 Tax=Reticulomyxa filosa TaxID=46433 RepID=X6NT42_RETFI|nr:hypothetical protein RFI_08000 [Reticulomyxa filosa]|eukprot:ETO29128.1 hypothetical protein RFI_08000 [Reticulomyxa filosa]